MSHDIKNILNQARIEFRNDDIAKLFKQNKKLLVILLSFAIMSSLFFTAYKINQKSKQEKFSEMLHQSMMDEQIGDIEKTKKILKEIHESSSAPSGVKSLASMRYAGFLLQEGNKAEAIKIYQDVNNCHFCDNYIKELAGLLMVRTIMTEEVVADKEDLSKKFLSIENNSKVLKYYIAEQRGYLEMYNNNLEKSYQIFEMIAKSPEVKESLKNRASDAIKMIIEKGYEPNKTS